MITLASLLALTVGFTAPAMAHCDSMDGPVVKDAQAALEARNVDPVLKWVGAGDEEAIRKAFDMTLAVRGESDKARDVADRYFFDTLVRIHRAGEGEGFTGIKPVGSADPAIVATDRALSEGDIDQLADEYAAKVREAIKHRFAEAYKKRQAADKSVEQGREYVEAYVQLTHFVESIANLVTHGASHEHRETQVESH
jgi:hypothetical protein